MRACPAQGRLAFYKGGVVIRFQFKNKLFCAYAALIAVVVVAVIALLLVFTRSANRDLERFHQQEVLASDMQELASTFSAMDTLASQVASNTELLNFFIPLLDDGAPDNYFAAHLMDSIRASSLLATINSTDSRALRISVFNAHGDYISAGSLYETKEVVETTLADTESLAALDSLLANASSHAVVYGPHADPWSDNADVRLFSLIRPLSTSYSARTYGYISVQQSAEALYSLSLWNRDDGASYALLNAGGEDISPHGVSTLPASVLNNLPQMGETAEYTLEQDGGMTVFAARDPFSGWTLVRLLPTRLLDAPYRQVYLQIILVGSLLLAILLVVVYLLADKISRPLREFSAGIERISLDNLVSDIPLLSSSYTEELQALDRAFRAMLLKLNQSIGFEMKAYMAALQSQMNPHFLYNMLSAIAESADEDGSPRTVRMCEKLSSMLRYMADYTSEQVSLQEDIANMRDYLDLMKVRYEEHFSYVIETCDALRGQHVPRMTLQPLVENCFQHGFKNKRPPWCIHVRFACENGLWSIEVRDNGCGISAGEIENIHRKIDGYQKNLAATYSELRLGGMGLVNTILRLRLARREAIQFDIRSSEDGGTTVVIGGSL